VGSFGDGVDLQLTKKTLTDSSVMVFNYHKAISMLLYLAKARWEQQLMTLKSTLLL